MKVIVRYSLIFLILFCFSGNLFAQQPETEKLFEKGKAFYNEKKYLEAIDQFKLAAENETKASEPSYSDIAYIYYYMGYCYQTLEEYRKAVLCFDYSLRLYSYYKADNTKLDLSANYIYSQDAIIKNDLPIDAPELNKSKKIGVYFTIDSIAKRNADTVWVMINAGKFDGLFLGSTGGPVTVYTDKNAKRGNEVVGDAAVIQLSDNRAIAWIKQWYPSDDNRNVIIGDNLFLNVYPAQTVLDNMLYNLGKLNVALLSNSKEQLYNFRLMRANIDEDLEEIILRKMLSEIHETYELLKDDTASFNGKMESGKFKGFPLYQVIKDATIYDVYAYINFVSSFPAKYMGKKYKVNETYATWVLNGTLAGETNRKWLHEFIMKTSEEKLDQFAKDAGYYLREDTLERFTVFIDEMLEDTKDKGLEKVNAYTRKLMKLAQMLGNNTALSSFEYYQALVLMRQKKEDEALVLFNKVLQKDPENYNALSYRSTLFGNKKEYEKAIADMKKVVAKYPNYNNGVGNIGWYYILMNNLTEARNYCGNAYINDSTNVAWAVNYGHVFLLNGDKETAKYYYQKTLDNLYYEEDYLEGPKKDFEIFFMNGWKRLEVGEVSDWMDKQYQSHYSTHLKANRIWDEAKAFANNGEYINSIKRFNDYVETEKSAITPKWVSVHNAYTWIGWGYKKLEKYAEALQAYQQCLELSRKHLGTQDIADNLRRLSEIYGYMGDLSKTVAYESDAQALEQKLKEANQSNDLYVLSIGISTYPNFKIDFASSDAKSMADTLRIYSKSTFTNIYSEVLTEKNARKDSIEAAFRRVSKKVKPGDTFLLFYSGYCSSNSKDFYLSAYDDSQAMDSKQITSSGISTRLLRTWFNLLQVQKQAIIIDAPASNFISKYISGEIDAQDNSAASNEIFILCPATVSVSRPELGHSLFTYNFLEGIRGQANMNPAQDGLITVKELDGYLFRKMGRASDYFLQTQSYTTGKDFALAGVNKSANLEPNKENNETVKGTSRGSDLLPPDNNTSTPDANKTDKPRTDYALLVATGEYDDRNFQRLINPIIDARALAKDLGKDYGFVIDTLFNPTAQQLRDRLKYYRNKTYNDSDQLFLFFAGHGIYDKESDDGYLVTKDSRAGDENFSNYLSYVDLKSKYLRNIPCNHIMVVLDACYGGSFRPDQYTVRSGNEMYGKTKPEEIISNALKYKFRKFISSGGYHTVPDGDPGFHSPFIRSFLETLRTKGPSNKLVTFTNLTSELQNVKPQPQFGKYYGDDEPGSDFIFQYRPAGSDKKIIAQKDSKQEVGSGLGKGKGK